MATNDRLAQQDAEFRRQVAARAKQTASNVQAAKASRGVADGLTVGNATQGEFDAARQRAAQAAPRVPAARPVAPSTITPAEAASLNAQSQGRFGAANPTAPNPAATRTAVTAAGQGGRLPVGTGAGPNVAVRPAAIASAAEGLAPAAATAAPAATPAAAGGAARAAGTARAVAGKGTGFLPVVAGLSAVDSLSRDTDDYYTRSGIDKPTGNGAGAVAKDVGVRTLGVLSDVGSALLDTGVGAANVVRGLGGAAPLETFGSRFADNAAKAKAAAPGAAPAANFGDVSATVDSTERAPRPAVAAGARVPDSAIVPTNERTGDASEVIGTFNGKAITRGDSDARSSKLGSFGNENLVPASGGISAGLTAPARGGGVSADFSGDGSKERAADINNTATPAGKLYAQLSQDKTPTGKRVAAQFLETYLGTGTQELGSKRGLAGDELGANAQLQRGREGDAAQLQQENIRAGSKQGRTPQYVFNDDGSIGQISDGVLSTVKGEDGKPAKVSKGKAKADLGGLKAQEDLVAARIGGRDLYADETEYQAARKKALSDLAAELGIGSGLDGE